MYNIMIETELLSDLSYDYICMPTEWELIEGSKDNARGKINEIKDN